VGSLEFHTQLTSGQNNNKHRLSPKFIKPKFTNPTRDSHTHTHGRKFTTQPTHTQPKLLTPPQRTHQIGQLRKNPQKISFCWKSPFNRWMTTRDPQENRHLCLPEKIDASPRSTHLSQISFSLVLLLPFSSNLKRGSGGHAGLKERDCK
jgi:hypothetical protein